MNPTNSIDAGFVLVDGNDLNLTASKSPKESFTWTDETTKLLIREYKTHVKSIGRHPNLQTKKDLWELITREINKHGYNLTSVQTRNRLTTLGRAFKKKVRQGDVPQRIVKDTELQNDLNEIFMLKPFDEFANFDSTETTENNVSQFGDGAVPDPLTDLSFSDTSFIFSSDRDPGDLYKWDHRTTELLFNVYDEVNGNEILMNQFKTKMNMWNHITERLNEYGFIFSSLQVQNRIKTIIRAYKRHLHKNQTHQGHEVSIFPFEEQIKRVISKHFNGTLSPKKEKPVFDASLDEFDIVDKDDIANVIVPAQMSTSCLSPSMGGGDEKILLTELRLLREEEQQFRRDFVKFQSEHMSLMREENSLLRENNQLLKCLIEKMNHGGQI